jgi:hypothetical protein
VEFAVEIVRTMFWSSHLYLRWKLQW